MTALIFDFDGVLADSFGWLYRLNASAFRHAGLAFSEDDYRALFHGNVHASLDQLVRDEAAREQVARFKREHFRWYYSRVRLFPFAPAFVRRLERRHPMAVVSSSAGASVLARLDRYGLKSCFRTVSGSTAPSKEQAIREAIALLGSSRSNTRFITDTVGDVEVGRRMGLQVLAVTWGFHSRNELLTAKPKRLFTTPRALISYLERDGKRR